MIWISWTSKALDISHGQLVALPSFNATRIIEAWKIRQYLLTIKINWFGNNPNIGRPSGLCNATGCDFKRRFLLGCHLITFSQQKRHYKFVFSWLLRNSRDPIMTIDVGIVCTTALLLTALIGWSEPEKKHGMISMSKSLIDFQEFVDKSMWLSSECRGFSITSTRSRKSKSLVCTEKMKEKKKKRHESRGTSLDKSVECTKRATNQRAQIYRIFRSSFGYHQKYRPGK